jgi:hypothetical protein
MTARDPRTAADDHREESANRLLGALANDLAAEERALEEPDFEFLANAAEGGLDDTERAVWDELVARDPSLGSRAAAIAELAAAAYPAGQPAARVVPFGDSATNRRQGSSRPAAGWLAVAAAALGAIGLSYLLSRAPIAETPTVSNQATPTESRQLLFEDGFEGGDAGSWSATTDPG